MNGHFAKNLGGGSPLVHNFETLFQIKSSPYGPFWWICFLPFLWPKCDQNQKCLTVSVPPEEGQTTYGKCLQLYNIFILMPSLTFNHFYKICHNLSLKKFYWYDLFTFFYQKFWPNLKNSLKKESFTLSKCINRKKVMDMISSAPIKNQQGFFSSLWIVLNINNPSGSSRFGHPGLFYLCLMSLVIQMNENEQDHMCILAKSI